MGNKEKGYTFDSQSLLLWLKPPKKIIQNNLFLVCFYWVFYGKMSHQLDDNAPFRITITFHSLIHSVHIYIL